jgi:hypothetical protein
VNAYKNVQFKHSKHSDNTKHISVSPKEENSCSGTDLLFEKTENENGNDFQAQIFILPFFISYFQYELVQPALTSALPLAEKQTNPIYIEVCNFRI